MPGEKRLSEDQPDAGAGRVVRDDDGPQEDAGRKPKASKKRSAQVRTHYQDRHEVMVLMNKPQLEAISNASILQEGTGAIGLFFFSGAFWLLATLVAEHIKELKDYVPYFLMCGLSIFFGLTLMWVSWVNFDQKQKLIKEAFKQDLEDEED